MAITANEAQRAAQALMRASSYERSTVLSSQNSLVKFLTKVGEHALARKIADILEVAWEWLKEAIKIIIENW